MSIAKLDMHITMYDTNAITHTRQSKKRKYLKWFEEVFERVSSGQDEPLQIEEFQQAIHTDRVSVSTVHTASLINGQFGTSRLQENRGYYSTISLIQTFTQNDYPARYLNIHVHHLY